MPKKVPEVEQKIKNAIRDVLVIDPLISMRDLQQELKKKGFSTSNDNPLHRSYVTKLVKKVRGQNIAEADRQQLAERLSQTKERYRLVYERLLKIAFYSKEDREMGRPMPSYTEQIRALKEIMKLDLAILSAEMDAGVFERHLGTVKHEGKLTQEHRAVILNAFANFGIDIDEDMFKGEQPQKHNEKQNEKLADGEQQAGGDN